MVAVYSDVIMPASVMSAGVRGVNMRKNARVTSGAGYMQANVIWQRTLRKFELGVVPMTVAQWQAIEGLFEVTEGGAYGFLMLDPKDQTVASTEGKLQGYMTGVQVGTVGNGYGVPTLRTFKRYTSTGSSRTKDRKITRPYSQTLYRNAGAVTAGAGAGQYSIDATTGIVTFVADASQAVSSFTVGATTVINFSSNALSSQMAVNGRIYLTGVTGTAATTLNSLSHLITAIGATSVTVSTVTTGLTATGGTAYKYPQPTDAMTWAGRFYVPVQFESDQIDFDIVAGGSSDNRLISGPSVVLVEVME